MRKKQSVIFVSIWFLLIVDVASAQERIVGVSVGNWFKYDVDVDWFSTDPNATFPPSNKQWLLDANETEWMRFAVEDVHFSLVFLQTVEHLRNGTEKTDMGEVNTETGMGNMSGKVVSANLSSGDLVYTQPQYSNWILDDTLLRTYPTETRETNHLNMTIDYSSMFNYTLYDVINYYWDRSTGIMVEYSLEGTNETMGYTTTWSMTYEIIESNTWTVPEIPNITSMLIMAVALTVVMVLLRRKMPKPSNLGSTCS